MSKNGKDGKGQSSSFGLKLLKKMGWKEGSGLGKEGEGIVNPIEVNLRPKGIGLGFIDEPDAQESAEKLFKQKKDSRKDLSDSEDDDNPFERRWKKNPIKRDHHKIIEHYETVQADLPTRIIDMTGREAIEIDSLAGYRNNLSSLHTDNDCRFPDILLSLRQKISEKETDIIRAHHEKATKKAQLDQVYQQMSQLKLSIRHINGRLDRKRRIDSIIMESRRIIHDLSIAIMSDEATFEHWQHLFDLTHQLAENEEEEISKIILAIFADPVNLLIEKWNPFTEPDELLSVMKTLSEIRLSIDVSHQLLYKLWLPTFRSTLVASFDPTDIRWATFFTHWSPLLKAEVKKSIFHMIIEKRLEAAIEVGEGLKDWIPRWLPILDKELVALVRRRLTREYDRWNPEVTVQKTDISFWMQALPEPESKLFMARAILPKLSRYLEKRLLIDPSNQDIDPLMLILDYEDVVEPDFMADVLRTGLFKKLRSALHAWMTSPDVDFVEVSEWYEAWKSIIPEGLSLHPIIQEEFAYLLTMIDALIDNPTLPLNKFL